MKRIRLLSGVTASVVAVALPLLATAGLAATESAVPLGSQPSPYPSASAAPIDGTLPALEVSATRTPNRVPEPEASVAPISDAVTVTADDIAPVLQFLDAASVGGAVSPWDSAVKDSAPNVIAPAYLSTDPETMARVAALSANGQSCPGLTSFTTSGAPSVTSAQGVAGTTSQDLIAFAERYNQLRYENCLEGVTRFVYDACMEQRLFWMAESPSPDPLDAWGHVGSVRIDGVPSVGCDGNLAGGSNNTGATVATKWWESLPHRASLYRTTQSTAGVCIALAMTHGGIDEPVSFVRAAAVWRTC